MGNVLTASASVSKSDVVNEIIQEQRQKGGQVSCQNVTGDIKLVFDKTTARNILVTQECTASLQQIFTGLQKELTDLVQEVEAVAKSGGILSAELSVAISDAKTLLEQKQIQECGNVNVNNIRGDITVDATESNIYDFKFSQVGSAEQICAFDAVADLIAKIKNLTKAETKGGGTNWIMIAIAIGIVLALGGGIFAYSKRDENKMDEKQLNQELLRRMQLAQKGGSGSGNIVLSLIFIMFIVLFICGCN